MPVRHNHLTGLSSRLVWITVSVLLLCGPGLAQLESEHYRLAQSALVSGGVVDNALSSVHEEHSSMASNSLRLACSSPQNGSGITAGSGKAIHSGPVLAGIGVGGTFLAFFRDAVNHRPPGSEPLDTFYARVRSGILTVFDEHPEGHILLVCHLGVMRAATALALEMPLSALYRMHAAYAGRIRLRSTARGIELWFGH